MTNLIHLFLGVHRSSLGEFNITNKATALKLLLKASKFGKDVFVNFLLYNNNNNFAKKYIKHTHCLHLAKVIPGRQCGHRTYLKDIWVFNRMTKCHILKLNCRRWETQGTVVVKALIWQFRTSFLWIAASFPPSLNTRLEYLKFIEVI